MEPPDQPPDFDFEAAIHARARYSGLTLSLKTCGALAGHARRVLHRNPVLHLTAIVEPGELVERHLGEAFEGASLLESDVAGTLVDLGSGNGYPGLPLAAARPGLRPVLVEASPKKAAFLRELAGTEGLPELSVLERQIQRAEDLGFVGPIRVLTARALSGWERVLPKLAPALQGEGRILLWGGTAVERVARRAAWQRLRLVRKHPLPQRDRSWIWEFARAPQKH